jgi:Protein of unknown function (DUF3054)
MARMTRDAERTRSSSDDRPAGRTLAVADAAALLAFVAVGLRSHRIGAIVEVAARNAVPLAAAWSVVSLAVGTYRRRDVASLALTWAVAVPIALLARTWWVGSPQGTRIALFIAVGLAFTALFLLIGRLVVAASTSARPGWRRP